MDNQKQTSTGEVVLTWREYLASVINPLREEIVKLNDAIGKMSVSDSEFSYLRGQCEKLDSKVVALENRIEKLEQYHNIGMWVFRLIQGVGVAVAISALIGYLVG